MSEKGYEGNISVNTESVKGELGSLRSTLASTNWALRVLGLPPESRKSLVEIQKMIRYIRMLQMLTSGSSYMGPASMLLRTVGLGNVIGGIRILRKASKLLGD